MVAAQLRDIHVSIRPGTYNATERMQEDVFHPITESEYVTSTCTTKLKLMANRYTLKKRGSQRAEEHETAGRPPIRVV